MFYLAVCCKKASFLFGKQMKVDIIVATHNRPGLLKETLKSVTAQTYSHWTCWIAEDGETAATFEAIKPFLQDDRFIYLPGKHAGFPAVPRNRAICMGTARYVAILDDDDLWLPEKLEKQVAFLDSHPDCVLLGCNAFRWPGTGSWEKCPLYFKKNVLGKIRYAGMLEQNYVIHSSAILRRASLDQAGLYNETLNPPIGEDYELWLRMGVLGEMWALPEPHMVFRQTPPTYYSTMDRPKKYQTMANIFESALSGAGEIPSPLSLPENRYFAAACRHERDFYRAGPRFLGRFRHEMSKKIKRLCDY